MASKLQEYSRMSEEVQRQLAGRLERWQSFLKTAPPLQRVNLQNRKHSVC